MKIDTSLFLSKVCLIKKENGGFTYLNNYKYDNNKSVYEKLALSLRFEYFYSNKYGGYISITNSLYFNNERHDLWYCSQNILDKRKTLSRRYLTKNGFLKEMFSFNYDQERYFLNKNAENIFMPFNELLDCLDINVELSLPNRWNLITIRE